jgi:hypothetical protein
VGTFYSGKRGFSFVLVRHFLCYDVAMITTVFVNRIRSSVIRFVMRCCLFSLNGRKQTFTPKPRCIFTGCMW